MYFVYLKSERKRTRGKENENERISKQMLRVLEATSTVLVVILFSVRVRDLF
ncbi:UNVERIFIED_CONTAM: hypothetical protein FKN15_004756 [Acipenser sinensis]